MNSNQAYLINQSSNQTWALDSKQKNVIGRGIPKNEQTNLILLPHPTVSKIHACLWLDEQSRQWYFENASRNGSSLNGREMTAKTILHDGDKITIGPFDLFFCKNLLAEEGTVEIQKPNSLSSQEWGNSPTRLETAVICIIFAFAIVFSLVWMMKMFSW